MVPFIDVHTHLRKADKALSIVNHYPTDDNLQQQEDVFSCGIHPWFEDQHIEDSLELLKGIAMEEKLIAVGECGLDKRCDTPIELQRQYFEVQVDLASEHQLPLIIHCVKAWQEVYNVLVTHEFSLPVIFHGFSGNVQMVEQMSRLDAWFSFGKPQLARRNIQEVIEAIPEKKYFFETDDSDQKIAEVYNFAARTLVTEEETLKELIYNNYIQVFGDGRAELGSKD